jgi:hypothetical protein
MLYGRQKELQTLSRLVAEASAGRGGALIVEGDAGVGKTALLRRAVAAAGSGTRVLTCSGVQAEVALAFGGLQRLLTPLLDQLPELPDDQAAALRTALGLSTAPAADLLVRTAVLSLLDRAAARTPLLLVADDLHWLDPATAGVLLFAARRIEGRSIAFLAAVREVGEATGDLPQLTLGGLAPDAASALLDAHGWGAPGPARCAIAAAVGGNPLALQELVRLGSPAEVAEKVVLTGTAPLSLRLREVFAERTRELPESARTLLLVAAAEDSGHTGTVLAAAARLAVDAQALDVVEAAGYLEEVPSARLRFRHPLVRAAVDADASARRRALAHRALADELATQHPEGGQRERAVGHRALAATGPDEQLAEALEAGAETVRRRGGLAAAAAVLHRAALLSPTEQMHTRPRRRGPRRLEVGQPAAGPPAAEGGTVPACGRRDSAGTRPAAGHDGALGRRSTGGGGPAVGQRRRAGRPVPRQGGDSRLHGGGRGAARRPDGPCPAGRAAHRGRRR